MFKYLLFFNDNDAHFLLFSLVLVYLYRNKRRGRPGIDKEEHNEGKDENNGDNEAWDEAADDKTDEAEGQEDGRGGGGSRTTRQRWDFYSTSSGRRGRMRQSKESYQDERDEDRGRGTQHAGVSVRSRWPSAGDLGGDGRAVGGARVPDGAQSGALETSAVGQSLV